MSLDNPAVTYVLLVIPSFFACTVIAQGVQKKVRGQKDGVATSVFGVFLLALIAGAYWLYIR